MALSYRLATRDSIFSLPTREVNVTADFRRPLWIACALSGALAVILGAFGAHALSARLPAPLLAAYHTGVTYQMWHTVALMALLAGWRGARAPRLVLWCWCAGVVLFSGSLYLLALSGIRALGMITPVGGTLLILGWLALAYAWLREERR